MESCEKATFHSIIQSNTGWIQNIILGVKYSFRGEGSKKHVQMIQAEVPEFLHESLRIQTSYIFLLSYTYKFSHMWYSLTSGVETSGQPAASSVNILDWECVRYCILTYCILIIVYCVLHAKMTIKYAIPADCAHCYKLKQHVVSDCIRHNLNSPSYHQTKMFITNVNLLYSTFSSIILLIFKKYQTCWRCFYTKWNVRVPVFSTFVSTHTVAGCC